MMTSLIAFLTIAAAPGSSVLEFDGGKGIEFFGICVSKETGETKKIEGVAPSKVFLDVDIKKCSIQKKGSKGVLKVRLFHDDKLVSDRSISDPKSGIEIVIPFF